MKPKPQCPFTGSLKGRASAMALISISVAFSQSALATDGVWNKTTNNQLWSSGANWTGGVADGVGATATINTNIIGSRTINLDSARTLGILNIGDFDGTNPFSITSTGASTLTFDGSGAGAQINELSTSKGDTINAALILNDNLTISNASANTLTLGTSGTTSGITAGTAGTKTINITGAGSGGVTINSIIADGSGTVAITKNSPGTLTLSAANTYSGGTILTNGTLSIDVGSVGSVGSITSSAVGRGTLALNGGMITASGATARTILNAVTIGGNVILGDGVATGSLTFSANTDLGGGTRTLTTASNVVFDGIVSNGGLTKAGSGVLTFNAANTYSGGTTLNDGTLRVSVGNVGSVGAITSSAFGTGTLTLNGGRLTANSSAARAILNAHTIGGNVTLGDTTLTGALTFSANTDLGGATRTLTIASAVTLDGSLSNGGIIKEGAATLTLSGNNTTFSGPITVNGGTLRVMGTPSTKSLGTGLVTLTSGVLAFQPNNSVNFGNNVVVNGDSTISNAVTVQPKTMTLGTLSIGANTLTIMSGTGVPPSINPNGVTFGAATLSGASQFVVNNQVGGAVTTLFTLASLDNGGFTPQFSGDGNTEVTGAVTGAGGLTMAGTGRMILSGANTYTGATTISVGTLLIDGDNSAATGAVNVASPATLGGGGIIGGAVSVSTGAVISPGDNGAGNFTLNNGLTLAGSYSWDLVALSTATAGTDFDRLTLTVGDATITGAGLGLNLGAFAPSADPFWDITQTWTGILNNTGLGSLTGAFAITNDQSAWASLGAFSTTNTGNDVNLVWTAVPEPDAAMLVGGLGVLALLRRRRA
jgi:trimeric autotransporter adhesin